jgi:hypothetical protein
MDDARSGSDGAIGDADDSRYADLLVRTLPEPTSLAEVRAGVERRVARRRSRRVAARAGVVAVAVVGLAGGTIAALRSDDDGTSAVAVADDPSTTAEPTPSEATPSTAPVATTSAAPTTPSSWPGRDCGSGQPAPVGSPVYLALYCGGDGQYDDPMAVLGYTAPSDALGDRMAASLDLLRAGTAPAGAGTNLRNALLPGFLLPGTTVRVDEAGAVTVEVVADPSAVPNLTTSNVTAVLTRQLLTTFFAYPETTSVTIGGQCIGSEGICPFVRTRAEWDVHTATAEYVPGLGPPSTGSGLIPADPHELEELQQRLEEERQRQAAEAAAAAARETTTTSG